MRKLITINRQFSSGGREIGKQLADELNIAYYDKELISKMFCEAGLDADYISRFEESAVSRFYPFTFGRTLTMPYETPQDKVYVAQTQVIHHLAEKQDCVIVGRCANHIFRDSAFRVFIYSSNMEQRIQRCYDKVPSDKIKSKEELQKSILAVDKTRSRYYEYYTGEKWLDLQNYNFCIDTAKVSVKQAVKMIATVFE